MGCLVVGCIKDASRRGLCQRDYDQWKNNGLYADIALPIRQTNQSWLTEQVALYQASGWPDTCVLWPFGRLLSRGNYGAIQFDGETHTVHGTVWYLVYSEWPNETIDHVRDKGCEGGPCFNVTHLEDVPQRVNSLRRLGATEETFGKCGHLKIETNVRIGSDGYPICLTCRQAWFDANRERLNAQRRPRRRRDK
jgi:hypothetical protein